MVVYAECHYAECRYAECHYAECRYVECRYAEFHGTLGINYSRIKVNSYRALGPT